MTIALARDAVAVALLAAAVGFVTAATVALFRFPDATCRLHAIAKADTAGLGLVALAVAIRADSVARALAPVAVWGIALFASATISQLVGRAAREA